MRADDKEFERPLVMVDTILFTIVDGRLCLLLTRREAPPYSGVLALPGGYVHVDEDQDLGAAARRVAREKIGFDPPYLEQLYTFSGPARDPRGWSVSIAYYALVPPGRLDAALRAETFSVDEVPALPFDHDRIVAVAVARLRSKATYSSLPAFLLPAEFTMNELHQIYQQAMGARLDKASFRHKILGQGFIEAIPDRQRVGAHRPAQLYRLTSRELIDFERKI